MLIVMMTFPFIAMGQMNKWVHPPNEIDFTMTPPAVTTLPVSIEGYRVSNAAHDNEGNLLFFMIDGNVYDNGGNIAGSLNGASFSSSGNSYWGGAPMTEIALFPLPGSCDTWCAFYFLEGGSTGNALAMTEITILDNGGIFVQEMENGGVKEYYANSGGLALSPPLDGFYANRHLYVVSDKKVDRLTFTGTGLPPVENIGTFDFTIDIAEADLSHDGTLLAWGDMFQSRIFTMEVQIPDASVNTIDFETIGGHGIVGLEFDAANENIYFSTTKTDGSLYRLNLGSGNVGALDADFTVGRTQLELAKDGNIYFVAEEQQLGIISQNTLAVISPLNLTNHSGVPYGPLGTVYTLPDQIDGQDYSQMSGISPIAINEINIGGIVVPNMFATSGLPEYGLCGPIDLELDVIGMPMEYQIDIISINSNNGTPFNTIASVSIPMDNMFPVDLRCLLDDTACDLFDATVNGGNTTFRIDVTVLTRCESVSASGFFEVYDLPNNVNGVLGMNAGNGASTCSASQNINTPCVGGVFSANIDLESSTGAITFFQLIVEEVDCGTGEVIQNLYNGPQVNIDNPGTIGLNSLEINGSTGFFASAGNSWVERCLRIEATVGNNCGATTDFTYFQFNGLYFQDPNDKNYLIQNSSQSLSFSNKNRVPSEFDEESVSSVEILAYPNPFKNQWSLSVTAHRRADFDLRILDSKGQRINVDLPNASLERGSNTIDIDMKEWSSGLYFYQLQIGEEITTGKILKVQ